MRKQTRKAVKAEIVPVTSQQKRIVAIQRGEFTDLEAKVLMLKENNFRSEFRLQAEIDRLRQSIEDIKIACLNELHKIAESKKPFKVVFFDEVGKGQSNGQG